MLAEVKIGIIAIRFRKTLQCGDLNLVENQRVEPVNGVDDLLRQVVSTERTVQRETKYSASVSR